MTKVEDSHGYLMILKHGYFSSKRGYVYEHIYNFQEFHKCCMLKWGRVHHKDYNKQNNRIENLEGMTNSQHMKLHMMGNNNGFYKRIDMTGRVCRICKSDKTRIRKNGRYNWYGNSEIGFMCHSCYMKA